MKRTYCGCVMLALSLVISGCVSHASWEIKEQSLRLTPTAESGLVYVIRESGFIGVVRIMDVFVDDRKIGELDSGSYLYFYSKPGELTIKTQLGWINSGPSRIFIEPNRTYYVTCSTQCVELPDTAAARQIAAGYPLIANVMNSVYVPRDHEKYQLTARTAKGTSGSSLKSDMEPSGAGIALSDVDHLPAVMPRKNNKAYAVVIGIEHYRQQLPQASHAAHDARRVAEYMMRVLGYPEENVITLINDRALKSDFEKYFEKWLGNNVETGDAVFVYYSGHGAPDAKSGSAYLVPYDGDPSFIDQTGYSLKRLYAALGKLPAKEIVVALDSCFSGAGGRSVLAKGARPIVLTMDHSALLDQRITVLTASAGNQVSSTYEEKGHGLFTYYFLKGIKNEDVIGPDGSLKIEDLYAYMRPQVERIARKIYNNEQTVQLIAPGKKNR